MGFVLERVDDTPRLGNRIIERAAPDRRAARGGELEHRLREFDVEYMRSMGIDPPG